jgi:hypothetical protein
MQAMSCCNAASRSEAFSSVVFSIAADVLRPLS